MTQEQLRMQMLAGIITEGQYKGTLEEEDNDTRYSIPTLKRDDEIAAIGKTYGEIRKQAPKVNAELVKSGQGKEIDAAFLNELMMLVSKYNIVGFENLVQKVKDLTSQGFSFNFSTYRN